MKINDILLINADDTVISVINSSKTFKFLIKNKAYVISYWDNKKIYYLGKLIFYPAILKMNYYVSLPVPSKFSKEIIFRRDQYMCAYCRKNIHLTIDHIVPKSLGGKSSFENCITACLDCNQKKSNSICMVPKYKPIIPKTYISNLPKIELWHPDWINFVMF